MDCGFMSVRHIKREPQSRMTTRGTKHVRSSDLLDFPDYLVKSLGAL